MSRIWWDSVLEYFRRMSRQFQFRNIIKFGAVAIFILSQSILTICNNFFHNIDSNYFDQFFSQMILTILIHFSRNRLYDFDHVFSQSILMIFYQFFSQLILKISIHFSHNRLYDFSELMILIVFFFNSRF